MDINCYFKTVETKWIEFNSEIKRNINKLHWNNFKVKLSQFPGIIAWQWLFGICKFWSSNSENNEHNSIYFFNCWFIVDSTQYRRYLDFKSSLMVGTFYKQPSIRSDLALRIEPAGVSIGVYLVDIDSTPTISIRPRTTLNIIEDENDRKRTVTAKNI